MLPEREVLIVLEGGRNASDALWWFNAGSRVRAAAAQPNGARSHHRHPKQRQARRFGYRHLQRRQHYVVYVLVENKSSAQGNIELRDGFPGQYRCEFCGPISVFRVENFSVGKCILIYSNRRSAKKPTSLKLSCHSLRRHIRSNHDPKADCSSGSANQAGEHGACCCGILTFLVVQPPGTLR